MKLHLSFTIGLIALAIALVVSNRVDAQGITTSVKVPCTNQNFETSPYCKAPVDWFAYTNNDREDFYGQLTSGALFNQFNITNELGVRLQKFVLEEAFWYVTDKGVIYADSDLQALSIYLAR